MLFLIQIKYDDDTTSSKVLTECEVVKLVNERDFTNIVDFEVYDISVFGVVKKLHYCGWQRGCRIQFIDEKGNTIIDGYGEDH